jgi:hypothetical protein
MTENTAPLSAPNGDSTRGIPYYEKLRRDLRDTLTKKRQLDKNMVSFIPFSILLLFNPVKNKNKNKKHASLIPFRMRLPSKNKSTASKLPT